MKLIITGVLGSLCILGSFSARPPVMGAQELSVSEKWATRGDSAKRLEFGSVSGMARLGTGEIWVSDNLNGLVIALDSAGRVLRAVTRAGSGPGEMRSPSIMASRADGGVAIYDVGRPSLDVFDAQGTFVRRIAIPLVLNPKGFVALPDGHFLLSGGITRNEHAIHRFGPDGRLQSSWHFVPETKNRMAGVMVGGGPLALARDGSVVFSQAAPHLITRFAQGGRETGVIAADRHLLLPIGDGFLKEVVRDGRTIVAPDWFFPQSRGVFALPDGRILNVVWFLDDGRTLWELYETSGVLVSRTEISIAYEPWSLTGSGSLLASRRDPDTGEHWAVELVLVGLPAGQR